jgi:hypothetical protein
VIILGKGDGTFKAPTFYSTGDVAGIAMGDFNYDGLLDLALTDRAQQNVVFFTGNGDGTFTKQPTSISTGDLAHGIVVADFNADGIDDLAYAVGPLNKLSDLYVAIGNGNGTFQVSATPAATQIGEFLTTGDTNADNKADIVSATVTEPGKTQIGNRHICPIYHPIHISQMSMVTESRILSPEEARALWSIKASATAHS